MKTVTHRKYIGELKAFIYCLAGICFFVAFGAFSNGDDGAIGLSIAGVIFAVIASRIPNKNRLDW